MSTRLSSLTDAALASSRGLNVYARYEPLTEPACDGFEICFGSICHSEAVRKKASIINLLHSELNGLTIKNVLFKSNKRKLSAWVTLSEATRRLDRTLIEELICVQ